MENALRPRCETCGDATVRYAQAVSLCQFSLDTTLGSCYLAALAKVGANDPAQIAAAATRAAQEDGTAAQPAA